MQSKKMATMRSGKSGKVGEIEDVGSDNDSQG